MFFRWKRPYRRIFAVIGSTLCAVLWLYVTVLFASTDRGFIFPLIASVIFSICAVVEISTYRKYGDARFHFRTDESEKKDQKSSQ